MSNRIYMTDGHAAGIIGRDGRKIYWNHHISTSTANPPAFRRHSTTQIRLDYDDAPIIGNIRTYLNNDGSIDDPVNSHRNLDGGIVPSNLYEWAMDAHVTFTTMHIYG